MRFVTSLSLQLRSLVVVVVENEQDGKFIAYGVDPNSEKFVFIREVLALGAFLKSVVDNEAQVQQNFVNVPVEPNSVDVPVKPPTTPWPQAPVVIALARSVSRDEELAQVSTGTTA
jgi:hypothetical protein